jgi:hypothetical protein
MTATYTTRTVEFGTVTFTAPAADEDYAGYVWIDTEFGHAANDRRQICYGGGFMGRTITSTTATLKADAQYWLRQRRDWMRKEGM